MTIGQLAAEAGVNVETVRYYHVGVCLPRHEGSRDDRRYREQRSSGCGSSSVPSRLALARMECGATGPGDGQSCSQGAASRSISYRCPAPSALRKLEHALQDLVANGARRPGER